MAGWNDAITGRWPREPAVLLGPGTAWVRRLEGPHRGPGSGPHPGSRLTGQLRGTCSSGKEDRRARGEGAAGPAGEALPVADLRVQAGAPARHPPGPAHVPATPCVRHAVPPRTTRPTGLLRCPDRGSLAFGAIRKVTRKATRKAFPSMPACPMRSNTASAAASHGPDTRLTSAHGPGRTPI
jgi:hypothetical protein